LEFVIGSKRQIQFGILFLKVQSQKIIIDAVRAKTVDDTTTTENQQEGKYSYFHSGSV
jgi:hypothetical protein